MNSELHHTGDEAALADDLLNSAAEISAFTGLPTRQVFYLVEKKRLPGVFRLGSRIFGLKSKIREGLERAASNSEVAA